MRGVEFAIASVVELHGDVCWAGDVDGGGHLVDHQNELVGGGGVAAFIDDGVGHVPGGHRQHATTRHGLAVHKRSVNAAVVGPAYKSKVGQLINVTRPSVACHFRLGGAQGDHRSLLIHNLDELDARFHGGVSTAVCCSRTPTALNGVTTGRCTVDHNVEVGQFSSIKCTVV